MGVTKDNHHSSAAARVAIVGAGPAGSLTAIALLDAAEARRRPIDVTLYHAGMGSGASRGPLLLEPAALSRLASFGVPLLGQHTLPLEGMRALVGIEGCATRRAPLFAASRREGAGDIGASLRESAALWGAALLEKQVDEIHLTPGGGFLLRAGGASARAEAVILACGAGTPLANRLPGHIPPTLWRGCAAELGLTAEARRRLAPWSTWIHGTGGLPDLWIGCDDAGAHLLAVGEDVGPSDLAGALLAAVATGKLPAGLEPRHARRVWVPAGAAVPAFPSVGHAIGGLPDGWGLADAARQAQELAAAWFDGGPDAMLEVSRAEARHQSRQARNRAMQRRLWQGPPPAAIDRALRKERESSASAGMALDRGSTSPTHVQRHDALEGHVSPLAEGPLHKSLADSVSPPGEGPNAAPLDARAIVALLWAWLVLVLLRMVGQGPGRPLPLAASGPPTSGVFVVDDDIDQADAICAFLEGRGIPCSPFYDGLAAVAAAAAARPAAVVLDVALPWLDGPTICRALRQHADIPVYLTTALPLSLARDQAAAAGGVKIFSKPLDLQELALRLQDHIRKGPPAIGTRFPPRPIRRADAVQPPA